MKQFSTIVILILAFSITGMSQRSKPTIHFENKVHDFGEILEENGVVSHVFEFTNNGEQPLVIHNVRTSCGCAAPEWTRTPVQPKRQGTIKITYDPRNRPGNFNQSITIASNAEQGQEILRIIGTVTQGARPIEEIYRREIGPIRLKHTNLSFGRVPKGTQKENSVEIINTSQNPVTITFARVPDHITMEAYPQRLQPGQEGIIRGIFNSEKTDEWGFVNTHMQVLINGEQISNNRISSTATVEEDFSSWNEEALANAPKIEFSQTTFDFGEIKQGEIINHSFIVTNSGKSDLILRRVRTSCGCTASNPDRSIIPPGQSTSVPVTFNSRGRSGRQNQSITIYTNDPDRSASILRLSGVVIQ
ncbi:DUF1573 domain-containing protein [Alkalitalea saponilacus]|uniref:DUF1573 domain-containing protein n=1 Tax=Alkalitalea saponilacus TaxID=889453 RepID=A0A1T5HF31_9BACT|nr:DUF1573 domain-containing protein [Alkalitalea saponilacus]ASB48085.1 hypothetical protein CDL62_02460 [Alkalitalea saponilacus]SKC19219.1 Protein of unknown function [Alkalitalea saponilacus]